MKKIFFRIIFLLGGITTFSHSNCKILFELRPIKDAQGAVSQDFMTELINRFHVAVLVETGTYSGDTVFNGLPLFNTIYTIELSNPLYQAACDRFKNDKQVHLLCGDSADLLPQILPTISDKILFWLDAHCSGGTTVGKGVPIPLSAEVEAIGKSNTRNAILLIDDIRGFCGQYAKEVDLSSVRKKILSINKQYQFIIFGDTALAFLSDECIEPSPLLYALTTSRLFDFEDNGDVQDLFDAEKVIATIQGAEREALLDLVKLQNGYYYFWQGLILMQENDFEQAMACFKSSLQWGPEPWRIHWYWAQAAYHHGDITLAQELVEDVLRSAPYFQQAHDFYTVLMSNKDETM